MPVNVKRASALADNNKASSLDVVITDPPYYDAIPYSDLMDFFYICCAEPSQEPPQKLTKSSPNPSLLSGIAS